jgi:hypothetical protein
MPSLEKEKGAARLGREKPLGFSKGVRVRGAGEAGDREGKRSVPCELSSPRSRGALIDARNEFMPGMMQDCKSCISSRISPAAKEVCGSLGVVVPSAAGAFRLVGHKRPY